ncbi:MAG: hypothetical protein HGA44_06560 [Cellulomonadaceae bacterium]|nr:hypothetical protein [Cellulomonadaceae bacterium]
MEDAALPVTVLRADVLAQERKELPIAEEFSLRFVESGIDTPGKIADFLGLDEAHILEAIAVQISENNLRQVGSAGRVALTPQGVEAVRNAASIRPVLKNLPVKFDRLTWRLADLPEASLVQKSEAQEMGLLLIPAEKNARIGLDDVTPAAFNALLRGDRVQILRIHRVSVKRHLYLPVQLLMYADQARGELELAVCIEDDLSEAHGLALDRIEAVKRLGLSVGAPSPRPVLDPDLEKLRVAVERDVADSTDIPDEDSPPRVSGVTSMVRSVSVFEHPDLLEEALTHSKRRLLIISPWVKAAVVTTDFRAKLEQRLRAGVGVTIAHGYGDDDSGSDEMALRGLRNMAARFSNLVIVRLRNTHAKILIFDDNWVSTSFNWLSFRGDPERTYRMEEGTLVAIPARVQEEYERYVELIEEQRRA